LGLADSASSDGGGIGPPRWRVGIRAFAGAFGIAALFALLLTGIFAPAALSGRATARLDTGDRRFVATGPEPGLLQNDSLMVSGMQWLVGAQQVYDDQRAALDAPAAFEARWRSRTAFRGLGTVAAARFARRAFAAAIGQPAEGPPSLPRGDHVARYLAATVAQIALPGQKRAVVESIRPMARETSRGHFAPIDLDLEESAAGFSPIASSQEVRIPKRLGGGVRVPGSGVSITPVGPDARPLTGSAGLRDGASVLYANTQTDADTTVKPTNSGFEIGTILRSPTSPQTLYYRVDAPGGAQLSAAHGGMVQVSVRGVVVGHVLPPKAVDAAGSVVPVSMTTAGAELVVHVASGGEHLWPIDVDPFYENVDKELEGGCIADTFEGEICTEGHTNWYFTPQTQEPFVGESCYCEGTDGNGYITWHPNENYNGGETAGIIYETQGESRVFAFTTSSTGKYSSPARVEVEILTHEAHERTMAYRVMPSETGAYATTATICARPSEQSPHTCEPSEGTPGNQAQLVTHTTAAGGASAFVQEVSKAYVWIAQEKGPELSFNTNSATIQRAANRPNVLFGSEGWISPYFGVLEATAVDHGVGVSRFEANIGGHWVGGAEVLADGNCKGVQCNETYATPLTYNSRMPDGEDELEINASDGLGLGTYDVKHRLKVDATPPHNLTVTGWSSTREISATPHTVTVEATDGKAAVPSSGVKSIAVRIDGGPETLLPDSACPRGECTASGKYTIDAESLPEGVNTMIVTATDNVDNVAASEVKFDVRAASLQKIGPGAVDPTTGQFELSATDVSLGGVAGVARVYKSREPSAGTAGPLGPQWALSLGSRESLAVLPDGSVTLTAATGGRTTFTLESNGEFTSPAGDGTLKVEAEELPNQPGTVGEYLVRDTATGTRTKFTQPEGTESSTPIFANQFGNYSSPLIAPESDAIDASGNVWATDFANNRIEEYTPSGALIASFGTGASGRRSFTRPWGVAVNRTTGNVYVTDLGANRVEELTSAGTFVAAWGWGVSDGKEEFEICEAECRGGTPGDGAGQFYFPTGIAVDASGNVWVVDHTTGRIEELDKEGHYLQTIGGEGSSVRLEGPLSIASVGNELYVVNRNHEVEEVSTSGKLEREWGHQGQGNGEFEDPVGIAADPRNGDLYVTDAGNNRIQEFNDSGQFIAKFGTAGSAAGQLSDPTGVAVNPVGGIYVADFNNNRLEEWTRGPWLPTVDEGPLKSGTTTQSYGPVEVDEGKTLIVPTEASAPAPVGVSCGAKVTEMKKGCRALLFKYGAASPAGEAPAEWGEYRGRLKTVLFVSYNPATGKIEEPAVAEYTYDRKGRLRAEWDPRIKPAVKTTYGYDAEGHVTALTHAGEEPWLLRYGALDGDPNAGRLLSVTRPAPATVGTLEEQALMSAPANTSAPTLSSTSPQVGTTLRVSSNGSWANAPLAYSYQWEDCWSDNEGTACTPIPGAVNQSYTPQASDAGNTIVASVTAENAAGAQAYPTGASKVVPLSPPSYSSAWGKNGSGLSQLAAATGEAITPSGEDLWITDDGNHRIEEFSTSGGSAVRVVGWGVKDGKAELETCTENCGAGLAGPGRGELSEPWGIGINPSTGNMYVADHANDRIDEFSASGSYLGEFGGAGSSSGDLNGPKGLAIDPSGDVWVADDENSRIEEFSQIGAFMKAIGWGVANKAEKSEVCSTTECGAGIRGSGDGQFNGGLALSFSHGDLYVDDFNNDRVERFSSSGSYVGQFGSSGTGEAQFAGPYDIATEPVSGDLYISDNSNSRVEIFNPNGVYLGKFGSEGTGSGQFKYPTGIVADGSGRLFVVDSGNYRLEKWNPTYSTANPLPAPPALGTSSVSTVEYRVPLTGTGLPNLTEGQVAKWGQTDYPVEGMATFAADTPMGWPATSYEHATITYSDEEGRTVNVVARNGATSTSEYSAENRVVRTLSAENRQAALASGETAGVTAATADRLDTKSIYDGAGRLLETLGPVHKVKLTHGKKKAAEEVEARERVVYSYNQNAPAGEAYALVTKTVAGAETASGEEFDERATVTSYSGQGGLGWTLRKPTSVTVDAGGLALTTTTRYDKTTGDVVETIPPGNAQTLLPLYSTQFSRLGAASGEVSNPSAVALDSNGNIWLADAENNRIDKFSSAGTFLKAFGWGTSNGHDELEVCTIECRAGLAGGKNQLSNPQGITYNPVNGDLYVSTSNDQILQFSTLSAAKPEVKAYGKQGNTKGKVEFNNPVGLATAANGDIWVADKSNQRLEEITESGKYVTVAGVGKGEYSDVTQCAGRLYAADHAGQQIDEVGTESEASVLNTFGKEGKESGQFTQISRLACDPQNRDLYVTDAGGDRVNVFTNAGTFVGAFGSEGSGPGELNTPAGIVVDTSGTVYVVDSANGRVAEWASDAGTGTDGPGTNGARTFYYTAEGESAAPECREHPEWADLVCQTEPVTQPKAAGLPELPVTRYTYNIWDEVEAAIEKAPANGTFHAVTREKVKTYDAAGRVEASETKSTAALDAALPKVTSTYDSVTGTLERQSTTSNGHPQTVTSVYNTIGQLEKYTDADGITTTYEYEVGGAARLIAVDDGQGTRTYGYSAITGHVETLVDSAAGTFHATYDAEGDMLTETYPNDMTAKYTYSATGAATGLEYIKNIHCTRRCPEVWLADMIVPSIHGETVAQTSTLSTENYTYDNTGRLTETQERPAGKDCVSRLYAYDEESNRTSLTTRQANSGTCATGGGEVVDHAYDSANRLDDPGIAYEEFGDTTEMPAADAGGHRLTASYYVDGQVLSQSQNGQTLNYHYDPVGRAREIISEGKTNATAVSHYPGPGEAVSWTSEGGQTWSRNISGIDGTLSAIETSAGAVTLQLHDLQGDIVGTAAVSETETMLLSTYDSTEFGVPNDGKTPPKYAWLGASGVSSEPAFESGIETQGGASYVPQVARALQTAPVVPPGAFPEGAGSGSPYTSTITAADLASVEAEGEQTFAEAEAERQAIDPKETDFFVTPENFVELAKYVNGIALKSSLIALALSLVPGIGEFATEAGVGYAEYLRLWGETFQVFADEFE
jgi:DNA-binding beta-propeller fold protein YncE